jgi:dTDP-glucose 4,6-dehydratase
MKTLLVTGGNGFIATNYIHYILNNSQDIRIVNLDSLDFQLSLNNHQNFNDDERYIFYQGSILNSQLVSKIIKEYKVEQIINFAAKSHVDNSIKSPLEFTENNTLGTQILLDEALKYELELFLQISTDEVYGSLDFDDEKVTEMAALTPNNPYSASKAAADCLVRSYNKTYDLNTIITRSGNNFGEYQYPEKFIPVIINKILANQKIPLYGNGKNSRDWIYVFDNVRAVETARTRGTPGKVYNIPGVQELSNYQLIKNIISIMNADLELIEYVTDRPGHDLRYAMNGDELSKLGFRHEFSFKTAIEKTIAWYQNHKSWNLILK